MSASDVVILFGGTSGERRVSVATAQHVSAVLPEAETWFVSLDGRVYQTPRELLQAFERPFE
ncbi:MAG TPA: D-alanine--D-alanine ligase, partial [Thermoanaerobaculia bacterium]